MKKWPIILALIVFCAGVLAVRLYTNPKGVPGQPIVTEDNEASVAPASMGVSVTLDTQEGVATASGISASTAYEALVLGARELGLEVEATTYDFGSMVERIGTLTNSTEKAWIYFVNDVSGDMAADQKPVKEGDRIQWRYIEPIF